MTGKNTIMHQCYDYFFKQDYDNFKVFFDWANEDWSKNPAFGDTTGRVIANTYDIASFEQNVKNLLPYFKHNNYLKIENKPVFFVHHPWFIGNTMLTVFRDMLDISCIREGFDGIHLVVNSIGGVFDLPMFNHRPNYKVYDMKNTEYRDIMITPPTEDRIETIAYGFNNSARMTKPLKQDSFVTMKGMTPCIQDEVTWHYMSLYRKPREPLKKILLVNAWNEWGEDMAIEPSLKKGTYYLELLRLNMLKMCTGPLSE